MLCCNFQLWWEQLLVFKQWFTLYDIFIPWISRYCFPVLSSWWLILSYIPTLNGVIFLALNLKDTVENNVFSAGLIICQKCIFITCMCYVPKIELLYYQTRSINASTVNPASSIIDLNVPLAISLWLGTVNLR